MRLQIGLLIFAVPGATAAPPCVAPEPIEAFRKELREGRPMGARGNGPAEEARVNAIRTRLREDPRNFHLWNMLLERVRTWPLQRELSAQLKAQLDREPANLDLLFLYGRSLISLDTPQAIHIFERVLQKDPGYGWVHKMYAYIYWGQSRFRDEEKLKAAIRAVFRLCPDDEEIYRGVRGLDDLDIQSEAARRLRPMVGGRTDAGVFPLWSALWAAEFKTTPPDQHPELRKRVRQDAEYIAGLHVRAEDWRLNTLREAYKLAGDNDAVREVQAKIDALPKPEDVLGILREWDKMHPPPQPGTSAAEQRDYWKARLALIDELLVKSPRELFLSGYRFWALHMLEETPAAELEKAAGEYLEFEKSLVLWTNTSPAQARIAEAWVARAIHLDEVPRLLQEALAIVEELPADDMYDVERRGDFNRQAGLMARLGTRAIEIDLHLRKSDIAAATAALRRMEEEIEGGKAVFATMRHAYNIQRGRYLEKAADIAKAEKRPLDALAYLQQALREDAGTSTAIASKARNLWRELGGTNEGWQLWSRVPEPGQQAAPTAPPAPAWMKVGKTLPEFELKDLNGRIWTAEALRGKTTLINIWATWCEPCRAELPYFAKIEESLKGRADVQAITFNVDDNTGLIEPFLREKGYTFPVVLAEGYVERLLPNLGIPLNWIVDRTGTLRLEQRGFSGNGEQWMREVLEAFRQVE